VLVQSYSPLGSGELLKSEPLAELAAKYNKTPAQIAIRWCLEHNITPVPRSTNPERMKQNLDVFDFALSADDINLLDEMPNNLPDHLSDPDKLDLK